MSGQAGPPGAGARKKLSLRERFNPKGISWRYPHFPQIRSWEPKGGLMQNE
jgi:hypothetical protein